MKILIAVVLLALSSIGLTACKAVTAGVVGAGVGVAVERERQEDKEREGR